MTSNPIHFVVSAAAPNPSLPGDHATDGDHATAPNPPQPLPTRRRPETRRPRPTPAPAPTRRRPSTLRRTATPRPRPTPVCCGSISPAASISSSPPRLPTLPRRLASLRHPAQPQLPPPPPRFGSEADSSRQQAMIPPLHPVPICHHRSILARRPIPIPRLRSIL
ncbi:hypothetical protein BS78_08G067600 [Paspalum vaginatum]|nr:hypothetical protein BS78_08G067600 [Paspalum vaginatum]KAJ1265312.1 hypothetical protein BS78_08G067600 [Paspalum vaginatum]KAJ1265313.1 hypothetical protein BS78_08G067600 [Paspalum vaginatum]